MIGAYRTVYTPFAEILLQKSESYSKTSELIVNRNSKI